MTRRGDRPGVIIATLAVAIVLTLVSLPPALDALRPYWRAANRHSENGHRGRPKGGSQ